METIKNKHYEGMGIDVIDLLKINGDSENFLAGNVVKYVIRRNKKNQKTDDIIKALDYMIMLSLECGIESDVIKKIVEKRGARYGFKANL